VSEARITYWVKISRELPPERPALWRILFWVAFIALWAFVVFPWLVSVGVTTLAARVAGFAIGVLLALYNPFVKL